MADNIMAVEICSVVVEFLGYILFDCPNFRLAELQDATPIGDFDL